ncbi:hypothetical protein ACFWVW_30995 [Streptomyces anthocyanicus]|uniref:hypothetical protein n=1 Tax=Streptomyces anthocyanicus TaxID=68174 RepID=UPI00365E38B5
MRRTAPRQRPTTDGEQALARVPALRPDVTCGTYGVRDGVTAWREPRSSMPDLTQVLKPIEGSDLVPAASVVAAHAEDRLKGERH